MREFSPHEAAIRDAVARLCAPFDDAYWLARDRDGGFPEDFFSAFAQAGWIGICVPEEYGGSIWISTAQVATKMQLLARTTPADRVARRTDRLACDPCAAAPRVIMHVALSTSGRRAQ
jgi:alkylation response protein AidB-like acyl-CoA dehydrogenase